MARTKDSVAGRPARIGRALASPIGVLVTVPLLVIAVGVGILLLGRSATRNASEQLAERQLREHVTNVQTDVAYALDQAGPLLARIHPLADRARPLEEVLLRLHDLLVARPGVSYMSISFDDGTYRGVQLDDKGHVEAQESRVVDTSTNGTEVTWFRIDGSKLVPGRPPERTGYDPRKRGFYQKAAEAKARVWTDPYPFYKNFETGITCAEPIVDAQGRVRAVLTVDFDVAALSSYLARPSIDQARSIVYTAGGVVLAYPPAAAQQNLPATNELLKVSDVKDPALDALVARPSTTQLAYLELDTRSGPYLATVAPIGGKRADVAVPLDWYVATLVPVKTLLGPTKALERSSVLASAGALAIAVGLALILSWNLVRMRRQVAQSRAEARSAEARAREMGSYRLVARLGAGGMGEVWRAEHRLLARQAAIKLIRPEALHDPGSVTEIRERFRREAQTLASMKSRHTIEIYDYGVTEAGVFYYVMELLDGLDLESLVVRYGPQPTTRVIDFMLHACASLAEAHDAGLLHRDIKPPNLYVCRAADEVDIVKLLDFGIVQTANEPIEKAVNIVAPESMPPSEKLTRLGAMLGTPGFMAPEQILGMQLDGRADLYALGCCAWWLLTGGEVFKREANEAKLLHKHIYEDVPSLKDRMRGWCPPELERAIAACLAKDLDKRPEDARTLARMLRAIQIPQEQRWTIDRAKAWWVAYQPPEPVPTVATNDIQIIMPGRTAQRPMAATSEEAIGPTIAEPLRRQ